MPHRDQSLSKQVQPSAQQAPTAMRMLTTEEMRAVGGGPEIKNGDAIVQVTPTAAIVG